MSTVRPVASSSASAARWDVCSQHSVQFYSEDNFLLDQVSEFLGGALAAGSAAVVVATPAHRDGLAQRLSARNLDLTELASQGRYIAVDAAETLRSILVNDRPDAEKFAALAGALLANATKASLMKQPPVAVYGEMVTLLCAEGKAEAALGLERLWNDLGRTHPFSLRCGYPLSEFSRDVDSEAFLKICNEHSQVIPSETYAALTSDEDRSRSITRLQQQAQVLETEKRERQTAARSLELMQAANRSLRELSLHVLQLQDDERKKIAHDLHEGAGQELALLGISLSGLESDALKLSPELAKELSETREIARRVSSRLRDISYMLFPPLLEELGLESALSWYTEEFGKKHKVKVKVTFPPSRLARLAPPREIALFRVVQECLTNIALTSACPAVAVSLQSAGTEVILTIDEEYELGARIAGAGVTEEPSPGFRGIQERIEDLSGTFTVQPRANGRQIRVVVPIRAATLPMP